MRPIAFVAVALLCASARSSWSGCFDAYNRTCLDSWGVVDGLAHFSLRCMPPAPKVRPISWCALGLNEGNGTMVVAEVMMAQVLASGTVVMESRRNIAHAAPDCMPVQLTNLTMGIVDSSGMLTVNWTRPASVPAPAVGQGYVDIVDAPVWVIAAISAGARVQQKCDVDAIIGHQGAYASPTQINVFQPGLTW